MLLSDRWGGPCVLLAARSADLARSPGRVVLPGGLVEPTDDGVVAAALREAHEKTGVDPAWLEVLGVMASMALPEDGLTAVPLLAWSHQGNGTRWSLNHAEVDTLTEVPLRVLASPRAAVAPSTTAALILIGSGVSSV